MRFMKGPADSRGAFLFALQWMRRESRRCEGEVILGPGILFARNQFGSKLRNGRPGSERRNEERVYGSKQE